jgi:hypothetical protein
LRRAGPETADAFFFVVRRRGRDAAGLDAGLTFATIVPSVEPMLRATPISSSSSFFTRLRRLFFNTASSVNWELLKKRKAGGYKRPSRNRISKITTTKPIPPLG